MPKTKKKSVAKSKSKSSNYKLQSIVIPMTVMNEKDAIKWVKKNYGSYIKIEKNPHTYRFRLLEPTTVKHQGYKYYKNKKLTNGVELVLAYKKLR